jgi:thiol-disulfide isomerase/thioredoxin
MRRVAFLLACALLAAPAVAQGDGLPLSGLSGEQLGRSDLERGKNVLVVWASWSPRCRDIVPRVNDLVGRWSGSARVVTVDFQEDRDAVSRFLGGAGLQAPVFLDSDGAFSKKHAVTTLPGLLVFVDGRVAYSGKLPDDADRVLAEVLR